MSNDMRSKIGIAMFLLAGFWIYRIEVFNLLITYEPKEQLTKVDLKGGAIAEEITEIVESDGYVGFVELNRLLLKHTKSQLDFSSEPRVFARQP